MKKNDDERTTTVTSPLGRKIPFHDPTEHLESIRKEDDRKEDNNNENEDN